MELLHQTQKQIKHYEDLKVSEMKETIEFPIEGVPEKSKPNCSTTSRITFPSINQAANSEETDAKSSNSHPKAPQPVFEENGRNNGKTEEHKKPPMVELPFINYAKKRKNTLHYIRVRKADVLPRNDIYEATDEDLDWISSFNRGNNDSALLSMEVFEQLIVLWENNSEKDYPIGLPQARSLTNERIDKNLFAKIEDVYNVLYIK